MWYRYNHTDAGVNEKTEYALYGAGTAWAKLALRMKEGYMPSDTSDDASHHHPIIRSGLKTREGTYAARVQFSELEEGALLMQSFWLQEFNRDEYTHSEADVEWNNWFELSQDEGKQTGESYVHVANHYNGFKTDSILQGIYRSGSSI
jgi:hypothetical protein